MKKHFCLLVLALVGLVALVDPFLPAQAQDDGSLLRGLEPISLTNARRLSELLEFCTDAEIYSLAFSPDGSLLASASGSLIYLWSLESGTEWKVLEGHTDAVWGAIFNPTSSTVISASLDHTLRLWDVEAGKERSLLKALAPVTSVALNPDGELLAYGTGRGDGRVKLWSISEVKQQGEISTGFGWPVMSVAFSPEGDLLVFATFNGIWIWDVQSGDFLDILLTDEATNRVAFSPDGTLLASKSDSGYVRLWDLETATQMPVQQDQPIYTNDLAFSPDGGLLVSSGDDNMAIFWNVETGKQLTVLEGQKSKVYAVAFSVDGTLLALGSEDGTVRLWGVRAAE